ncbi:rRNA maturation RNase YbeY [Curtanaerobium respiraculi]|uniref:rRNA maturation RNase YbeY n=1 Tax=Curtanaerobium respiraculi TaxID=2949669 RepID=UPI0024B3C360|nr:rRNA maturation RNase YbeY [Curtanaerobium respiraculi]
MDITINYEYGRDDVEPLPVEGLAEFVIAAEGKPANTEVSISFVDDDEMARLNEGYRGKRGPTDVLSFECDNLDDDFDAAAPEGVPYELGDVVIAVDVCKRQAPRYGNTFQQEIELLLTHGLLHLCGYDHIEEDEAEAMEARERALLGEWRSRS